MKILALPHGIALAHVTRPLEVGKALRTRGHEVVFACAPPYDHFITESGFECLPIVTEAPARALARVREGKRFPDDAEMLRRYVREERDLMRRLRPDVVLGDFRFTLSISTELEGVPYVTLLNACFTRYYSAQHDPPQTLKLTRLVGRRIASWLLPPLRRRALRTMAGPLNAFRRQIGLSPIRDLLDALESPTLNLITDLPAFAPTSGLPDHFRYAGPIMWDPPVPVPEWLDELRPREAIYVSLGSTGEANDAFRIVREALSGSEWAVMVTTGSARERTDWPANFYHVPYAPGLAMADRADLVVCHGGNGTIYQALAKATPVVCLPTFFEQELHSDRAVALGVGRKIPPHRLAPDVIRRACREMLEDGSATQRAREVAELMGDHDGPERAADAMLELES